MIPCPICLDFPLTDRGDGNCVCDKPECQRTAKENHELAERLLAERAAQ